MSYDIDGFFITRMRKQQMPLRPITTLQGKILKHICTTRDASYITIMKHVKRGRVTVLQSTESLVKRRYVEKVRIHPNQEKSKLTFKPTQKGLSYCLAFLDTDYDEVWTAHADASRMSEYNQRVRAVPDYHLRKKLINVFSRFVLEDDYFTEEGRLKSTAPEDIINLGLRIGLIQSSGDKSFDLRNLFDPKSAEFFRNVYTEEEQRLFKGLLVNIRRNLDSIIEQLPD